jgi:oligogalacturonide lyase
MNTPNRVRSVVTFAIAYLFAFAPARGQSAAPTDAVTAAVPPTTWIDPDTGHRVFRLTSEPGSDSFYFNYNSFTPDGKKMVFTSPDTISVLDLSTLQSRVLVKGATKTIIVGHKTPTLYYSTTKADPYFSELWSVNVDTGETKKLADLPRRATVVTINADETSARARSSRVTPTPAAPMTARPSRFPRACPPPISASRPTRAS